MLSEQMRHCSMTVYMRIQTGCKAAPARDTNRILTESIPERNRISLLKPVKIWGNRCIISKVMECICTHLVWIKDYNVWLSVHDVLLSSKKALTYFVLYHLVIDKSTKISDICEILYKICYFLR